MTKSPATAQGRGERSRSRRKALTPTAGLATMYLPAELIERSAARNPSWSLDVFVSRGVVFHSAAVLGASIYLLAMAAGGYYIRIYGGTWGNAIQLVFFFGAVIMLLSLVSSGTLQAKVKVFISKHFFNYKYDYRVEWQRFIETLSMEDARPDKLKENIICGVAKILQSPGGVLLTKQKNLFVPEAFWNMPRSLKLTIDDQSGFLQFIRQTRWIVDLPELARHPQRYQYIEVPHVLEISDLPWIVIPLFQTELVGLMILSKSHAVKELNWEDRDMLKLVAFHAAHFLQYLTSMGNPYLPNCFSILISFIN